MAACDVIVVGAGPAGSSCAAICARNGLRTLIIERARFPREKVCGDCVNPGCWPLFHELDLEVGIRSLPHATLRHVEFSAGLEKPVVIPLPTSATNGEISIKRSHLDALLLQRALEWGAESKTATVTQIERDVFHGFWRISCGSEQFKTKYLVAADGRNSTVCRLLGLLPPARQDRIGVQVHFPLPQRYHERVSMRFHEDGYCGLADVGDESANLCLVAVPPRLAALKRWAIHEFSLAASPEWRTVSPLSRSPVFPRHGTLLLAGDAARVVEPFTGEGIYYALASGMLAGKHLADGTLEGYPPAHRDLYRGRLWVNELARFACLHPSAARALLTVARRYPSVLAFLTRKVSGHEAG